MKRATFSYLLSFFRYIDFNPRPREEGDLETNHDTTWATVISIHALVKRATPRLSQKLSYNVISIHALVKRATVIDDATYLMVNISIHALVKRATLADR